MSDKETRNTSDGTEKHKSEKHQSEKMRLKLIACDVFMREICQMVAVSPHIFDLEFTEKDSHNQSDNLRKTIQEKIDVCPEGKFDGIALCYGICGNSTVGLRARDTRLVIPRAHDCCTLFLGSKEKFRQHFKDNPSQPFSSAGYMERSDTLFHDGLNPEKADDDQKYQEYVEKYGEENARYIYESMYGGAAKPDKLVFIEIPETSHLGYCDICRKRAAENDMKFVMLDGNLDLVRKLVFGQWDPEDFLIIEPGERSIGIYDWESVIGKEPSPHQ
jgi:hypothetical protein